MNGWICKRYCCPQMWTINLYEKKKEDSSVWNRTSTRLSKEDSKWSSNGVMKSSSWSWSLCVIWVIMVLHSFLLFVALKSTCPFWFLLFNYSFSQANYLLLFSAVLDFDVRLFFSLCISKISSVCFWLLAKFVVQWHKKSFSQEK